MVPGILINIMIKQVAQGHAGRLRQGPGLYRLALRHCRQHPNCLVPCLLDCHVRKAAKLWLARPAIYKFVYVEGLAAAIYDQDQTLDSRVMVHDIPVFRARNPVKVLLGKVELVFGDFWH